MLFCSVLNAVNCRVLYSLNSVRLMLFVDLGAWIDGKLLLLLTVAAALVWSRGVLRTWSFRVLCQYIKV